ncbi:MAG TPA: DNA polymerase III subunit gamma/tau [Candidatus Caccoplasma intestinavium]|uniref:DNA polymerase III subunit gamma/tau n=1 Tax=Candidatus Caccoplasma intestinavium TaxID=2840716 RepID=A0A9D1KCU8_9BACT|nr:DNA polymerase III subunit gamma/tau [Candidatus Caccoplasma intestinavium]
MDNYIVSARKYRPTTFRSVVGQKALVQTLKAAVVTRKLAHAYLFCGTRGVGKTTCARIFAKTINCEHPTPDGEACNECESCRAFNEQRSYNIIELDAASNNSVDEIRSLIDKVRVPPQLGRYKVFIIDEVHMLSTAAFNAFLKTLEEPPHHAIFILATTEKHKLLPTILSRCQIYDFQRITIEDIVEHLRYVASQEGFTVDDDALNVIARKADGGMRDALSIFDQVAASSGGNITYQTTIENLNILDYDYYFRLTDALLDGNVPEALLVFDSVLRAGFGAQLFVNGLSSHFRDLMVSKDAATLPLLDVGTAVAEQYARQAERCDKAFLYKAMDLSNRCDLDYRISNNKRLLVELMLIKICSLGIPQEIGRSSEARILSTPSTPAANPRPAVSPTTAQTNKSVVEAAAQSPSAASEPQQEYGQPRTAGEEAAPAASRLQIPRPQVATPQAKIPTRKIPRISLKHGVEPDPSETPVATVETTVEMNEPFALDALHEAWLRFTKKIPTETVLVQTMYLCMPQMLDATTFEVVVDNRAQMDKLNGRGADLMAFLRTELRNTHLEMRIREREREERQKAFSPGERFVMLAEKNPELNRLKDIFGLELS